MFFCYCWRHNHASLFAELGLSSSAAIKGISLKEFLEKFAKDEENEKVAADFYPLSNDIVMFQWSEILAEVSHCWLQL